MHEFYLQMIYTIGEKTMGMGEKPRKKKINRTKEKKNPFG